MKNFRRRFIAFSAMIAVVLSACCVSCNDKNKKAPSLTDKEKSEIAKDELTFTYDSEDDSDDLDAADPTAPNSDNAPVVTYIVTDAAGQPVTETVTVTQANGQPQTEANGEVVTEAVTVTGTEPSTPQYKPNMKTCKAWWLDVSKEKDFEFNNEFIEVEFKIKDTTPDGRYPINIVTPQFSDLAAQSATYPDNVYNGYVYVSRDKEEQQINDGGKFTVYTDSASGKQGDTVVVKFNIRNNPGLCAMFFEFEYDKNALTIVEARATGEFAEVANAQILDK